MARVINWVDGTPIGLLIELEDGDAYIVPPIVHGEDGHLIQGENVLQAIVEFGRPVRVPVVENCTAAYLAELDRRLARASDALGVPVLS
jgi:hypothetical protein